MIIIPLNMNSWGILYNVIPNSSKVDLKEDEKSDGKSILVFN